jgi:hypothetical protein
MASIGQYYNTLVQKLTPSFVVQQRGSVNQAIRSSSTFGPQIQTQGWTSFRHTQNPILHKQLNEMNK